MEGNNKIFCSKETGLKGLMDFLCKNGRQATGVIVFDKVVGRAAALLSIYLNVKEVYGKIGSRPAADVLQEYKVVFHFENVCPSILDKERIGLCPMEQLSLGKTPEEFYAVLTAK